MSSLPGISEEKYQRTYLKDYRKPDYLILQVTLVFHLGEGKTVVESKLHVSRSPENADGQRPLLLDGDHLKLKTLKVNGCERLINKALFQGPSLILEDLPESCEIEIVTEIEPQNNHALEGLYKSGAIFATQNEPNGFRRITYYLDRPDVMARFKTKIIADKKKYPILLSNGNPIDSGDLDAGRHYVVWEDPFPKPCYLFALVAGDLEVLEDTFQTQSGRNIDLRIYTDKGRTGRCQYAMECLKRAMKWDEETFGLECDLNTYMIVAVDAFNSGAMENKGLNIFNAQYILADPETATDTNYEAIESVIGHEYFHNWTGNRVTCRDWFQLTLKEGLTIFRDQEFSADMTSRPVKRISDVRMLRDYQFVEDAGPNAHPVRPDSYLEIDNFYTVTIYEKGSEIIRMIDTLIGRAAFRKGIQKYFELYDGQAVTTDEFIHAMEMVSGLDLTQFKQWYENAGTPVCKMSGEYCSEEKAFTLTVEQSPPKVFKGKKPVIYHFPLSVGLLGQQGHEIPLKIKGDKRSSPASSQILSITRPKESFIFENIKEKSLPSLFRNFSAPVLMQYPYTLEDLIFLFTHDTDSFNRFDSGQKIALYAITQLIKQHRAKQTMTVAESILNAFRAFIRQTDLDPAFQAETLRLPSLAYILEIDSYYDVEAAYAAREYLMKQIALQCEEDLKGSYQTHQTPGIYVPDALFAGKRAMKNIALAYLINLEKSEYFELAWKQFAESNNMTDRMAGLMMLCDYEIEYRCSALQQFYDRWKQDTLVMNKWFAVQASSKQPGLLKVLEDLEKNPAFDKKNPNKIRSLFGVFSRNLIHFHKKDGSGYAFIAQKVREVDRFNPSVAASLSESFQSLERLDRARQSLMRRELESLIKEAHLSRNTYEIISKVLRKK